MPLPFNPLQLQTYDISTKDQARMFVLQLGNMLSQALTPNGLAAILASAGVLNPSAMASAANTLIGNNTGASAPDAGLTVAQVLTMLSLVTVSTDLGVVSTNQTVNCANASLVTVRMAINTAVNLTLTLSNIVAGAHVVTTFHNGAGTAQTFKVVCTGSVTAVRWKFSATAITAMDTTGLSIASGGDAVASGGVVGGTGLFQVAA